MRPGYLQRFGKRERERGTRKRREEHLTEVSVPALERRRKLELWDTGVVSMEMRMHQELAKTDYSEAPKRRRARKQLKGCCVCLSLASF